MAQRKPMVAGNWKNNGSIESMTKLIRGLNNIDIPADVDCVVAPVSISIPFVRSHLKPGYQISAQNVAPYGVGAYTGEISADILRENKVEWAIVGHAERRNIFHESDHMIGNKIAQLMSSNLKAIACFGETLEQRNKGKDFYMAHLSRQLQAIWEKVSDWSRVVLAYEPIWAIGTGVTASPESANEVHTAVRAMLAECYGDEVANNVRILYGGSVKSHNAADLIRQSDIDGFLVGGASLDDAAFATIMQSCSSTGRQSKL